MDINNAYFAMTPVNGSDNINYVMVERYSHRNGEHIQAAMDKLEGKYTLHA